MRLHRLTAATLCIALLTSCKAAQKREESYIPTREIIHLKSNAPVYEVYDRWENETGKRYLYDGKNLIASTDLPAILADSPSPEASSLVSGYNTWDSVSKALATTSILAILVGAVGRIKDKDGDSLSPSTSNTLLASGALVGVGAIFVYRLNENRLRDSLRFHNESIRPKAPAAVTFNIETSF